MPAQVAYGFQDAIISPYQITGEEVKLPSYKFTCPKCNGHWLSQVVTTLQEYTEYTEIRSLRVDFNTKTNDYELAPIDFDDCYTRETKQTNVHYICCRCEREVTQEDLIHMALANNL